MTTNVQSGNILDVLKKKMRATKEECEKYKEEADDLQRKLQAEVARREEGESEIAALQRRIQLLEDDLERSEERLATATHKLAETSHNAEESERMRKVLENKSIAEEDRVAIVEQQLAQAGRTIDMDVLAVYLNDFLPNGLIFLTDLDISISKITLRLNKKLTY